MTLTKIEAESIAEEIETIKDALVVVIESIEKNTTLKHNLTPYDALQSLAKIGRHNCILELAKKQLVDLENHLLELSINKNMEE